MIISRCGIADACDDIMLRTTFCCVVVGVAAWLLYSHDQMLHGEFV